MSMEAPYLDRYDEPVVEQLEEGKEYAGFVIKDYYKKHTTIQQDDTARERAKNLTGSPCFERDGRKFRYLGVD